MDEHNQIILSLTAPTIYGNGGTMLLFLFIGYFLCLIFASTQLLFELVERKNANNLWKKMILSLIVAQSTLDCFILVVPLPLSNGFAFLLETSIPDHLISLMWMLLIVWIGNATIFPYIANPKIKKGFPIAIIVAFSILLIINVAFSYVYTFIGTSYSENLVYYSKMIIDFLIVTLTIPMAIKVKLITRSLKQPAFQSLKIRLQAFFVMLCIISAIFVALVTHDILTEAGVKVTVGLDDPIVYNCLNDESQCYPLMALMSFLDLLLLCCPVLVFLVTFFYFNLKTSSSSRISAQKKTKKKQKKMSKTQTQTYVPSSPRSCVYISTPSNEPGFSHKSHTHHTENFQTASSYTPSVSLSISATENERLLSNTSGYYSSSTGKYSNLPTRRSESASSLSSLSEFSDSSLSTRSSSSSARLHGLSDDYSSQSPLSASPADYPAHPPFHPQLHTISYTDTQVSIPSSPTFGPHSFDPTSNIASDRFASAQLLPYHSTERTLITRPISPHRNHHRKGREKSRVKNQQQQQQQQQQSYSNYTLSTNNSDH